ncbi:MAG: hypothetical protein KDC44_12770 [Phaeodactylibacter sp.]|nr:hypothetical protein [Phaeodactylibacter sp.]
MQRKRLILTISIILLFGLLCLGIWQRSTLRGISAMQAVPQNTALFLEYAPNAGDTLSEMTLSLPFLDWRQALQVERFQKQVQGLWSTARRSPKRGILGLRAAGEQGFVPFGIYEMDRPIEPTALIVGESLEPLSILRDLQIYEWTDTAGYRLALSFYRNLCLLSPVDFAVEDAIRQLVDGTPIQAPAMKGQSLYYVHLSALPLELSAFVKGRSSWLEPPFGDWLALSGRRDSTGTYFDGRLDGLDPAMTSRWLPNLSPELLTVVPDQTAQVQVAGIQVSKQPFASIFAGDFFKEAWEGAAAVGQFAGLDRDGAVVPFLVHRLKPEADTAALEGAIARTGELESQAYQLFTIRQLVGEIALPQVFSEAPQLLKNPYLVQYDNY